MKIALSSAAIVLTLLLVDAPFARLLTQLPAPAIEAAAILADRVHYSLAVAFSVLVFLFTIAWAFAAPSETRRRAIDNVWAGGMVLAACVTALLSSGLLKSLIGRARPELLSEAGAFAFTPLSEAEAWQSFPSASATIFFALAFALPALLGWQRGRPWLLGAAGILAASRVLAGIHYLSDLLAGLLLAYLIVRGSVFLLPLLRQRLSAFVPSGPAG